MLSYFIDLLYPNVCVTCKHGLVKNEQLICSKCLVELPYTGFSNERDNAVEKVFWGRVPIQAGMALLYFNKGNKVQQILHYLKYKNCPELGFIMGALAGRSMLQSGRFSDVHYVSAVPLHKKKQKQRGYNQSEYIASGIASALQVDARFDLVKRNTHTSTQTKKSRAERWDNVGDVFSVENTLELNGKHILLVDDVLTTGATLEACMLALANVPDVRISIAVLACA